MTSLTIRTLTYVNSERGNDLQKKTKSNFLLSEDVTSALARSKVTDRQTVHMLAATAYSLGHDVNDITLSRSSIQRVTSAHRGKTAETVKASFSPKQTTAIQF